MNIKIIASVFAAATVATYAAVTLHNYHKDIYSRFPEVDHTIARKAYSRFLMKSFLGEYGDLEYKTDEYMDALFLEEVRKFNR